MTHRVYSRDPQAKAHGRIRSATSSLTQDAALGAKVDDLFNDQEITRKFEALNDSQLSFNRLPRPRILVARAVTLAGTSPG